MSIDDPSPGLESMKMRFTLIPTRWYAMEMVGDEFGSALRHYSPIRVDAISPQHTGQRVFDLWFYHANYLPGVRTKMYTLRTLERGEQYLLAQSTHHTPARFLLVHDITAAWLRDHFRIELPEKSDADTWLTRHV